MASIARYLRVPRTSTICSSVRTAVACRVPLLKTRALSASAISSIRKYTRDHEWIDLSADQKTGVIGISEYAAEALGDVVYVELPEEGREVAAGDAIGAVESVKSSADINAPVTCRITHINMELEEKPGTIGKVPEDDSAGGGWIAKVALDEVGVQDLGKLMTAEEYKSFTAEEGH